MFSHISQSHIQGSTTSGATSRLFPTNKPISGSQELGGGQINRGLPCWEIRGDRPPKPVLGMQAFMGRERGGREVVGRKAAAKWVIAMQYVS